MKRFSAAALAATMLCVCAGPARAAEDYYPKLITLISELANLGVMADRCEKQLVNYGKDALKGAECAGFTGRYHENWPDRDSLENEILQFATGSEQGRFDCDDRCRSMLLRCEELRISITYVLDYMDYVREM